MHKEFRELFQDNTENLNKVAALSAQLLDSQKEITMLRAKGEPDCTSKLKTKGRIG